LVLALNEIDTRDADARLIQRIGLAGPWTQPVMGEVMAGSAAERAGLREGDEVLSIGPTEVVDGQQLRTLIRSSVRCGQAFSQPWRIVRSGQALSLDVSPTCIRTRETWADRRYVGARPA
jgi:regulator of sigma E protease